MKTLGTRQAAPPDPAALSARDYLVTWEAEGRERTAVWRPGKPMPLGHPARWILRRTPDGIFALRVEPRGTGYRAHHAIAIPPSAITRGEVVPLRELESGEPGARDWQVRVRPLRPIPAPYDPPGASGREPLAASHEYFLYCGLDGHLLTHSRVGTSFKIHVGRQLVFSYQHQFPGHVIAAAVPGVTLTTPEGAVREIPMHRPSPLDEEEWRHGRITWGRHWWRIAPVPIVEDLGLDVRMRPERTEDQRLSRFAQQVAIGLALVVFAFLVFPPGQVEKPPPLSTEVTLKAPKYVPRHEEPPAPPETEAASQPQGPLAPRRGVGPDDSGFARRDSPPRENVAPPPRENVAPPPRVEPAPVAPPVPSQERRAPPPAGRPPFVDTEGVRGSGRSAEPDDVEVVELETDTETEIERPRKIEPRWDMPVPPKRHSITARSSGRGSQVADQLRVTGVGRIEKSDIERTLERHLSSFQDCYRKALAKDPTAQGVAEVSWSIGTDGRVGDVGVVQTDLKDKTLVTCLTDELRQIVFVRPRGGAVQVQFPIVFSPTGF